jgi:hypothetical protein
MELKELQKAVKKFEDLLKNHCCKTHCNCDKEHLYCGYELDHGIELEEVIEILKNINS